MHCYAKMMRCHDSHMTSCILCAQDVYQTLSSCAWWGLGKRLSVYWHRQAVSAIATNRLLTPISLSTLYRTHNFNCHSDILFLSVCGITSLVYIPVNLNLCKEYCTMYKSSYSLSTSLDLCVLHHVGGICVCMRVCVCIIIFIDIHVCMCIIIIIIMGCIGSCMHVQRWKSCIHKNILFTHNTHINLWFSLNLKRWYQCHQVYGFVSIFTEFWP